MRLVTENICFLSEVRVQRRMIVSKWAFGLLQRLVSVPG